MTTHNNQHKREGGGRIGWQTRQEDKGATTKYQWEQQRQVAAETQSKMKAAGTGQQKGAAPGNK